MLYEVPNQELISEVNRRLFCEELKYVIQNDPLKNKEVVVMDEVGEIDKLKTKAIITNEIELDFKIHPKLEKTLKGYGEPNRSIKSSIRNILEIFSDDYTEDGLKENFES